MKNIKFLIILILAVGVGVGGFLWTKNNIIKGENIRGLASEEPTQVLTQVPAPNFPKTIGDFLVTNREICKEDGKPLAYFFGSSSCTHCVWEKPIAQKVFAEFKNEIAYHENFDSQADGEVFQKYADINPGYVPFFVLGCKYARVGAGENLGKTDEESKKLEGEALTAILCKLTDNKPSSVCSQIREKVSEVK